jgi:hypothetical protein
LRKGSRSLAWAPLAQVAVALPLTTVGFLALRPWLSVLDGLDLVAALGVSLLWGGARDLAVPRRRRWA